MPLVERLAAEHEVDLYWYNVDEPNKLERAAEVAKERGLPAELQIIPGKGRADPVWQMLNSRPGSGAGVPKFALLDAGGVLRYGGQDLEVVKDALEDPTRTCATAIAEDPDLHQVRVKLAPSGEHAYGGEFRFLGEATRLEVFDPTGDGTLDDGDFQQAPVLALDRDQNGEIDATERLWRQQVFTWRGGQFVVDEISTEEVSFKRSWLRAPRVDRQVMGLFLTCLDGRNVILNRCDEPRIVALWSAADQDSLDACETLAELAIEWDFELLRVSVDTDVEAVTESAEEHGFEPGRTIASGRGREDFLWQALAAVPGTTMRVPLFALIDTDGILRYAGHDLDELSAARRRLR